MKIYAQQGYGTGNRIVAGLGRGVIHGAILSPKDNTRARVDDLLQTMQEDFPSADRFFDPQYYASTIAHDDGCRLGKLESNEYAYFNARRRSDLERESSIRKDIRACLKEQAEMLVTSVIAPNIIIRRSLNSIEAVIAKNFIRNTAEVWSEIGDERPVYVTLAIDAEAIQDKYEVDDFLADITLLENRPHGFYVLINNMSSAIEPELIDDRTLTGWMMLNQSLSINGFDVINGYSDILTPFLSAAGGSAGATGWWGNLKVFSLDRFLPNSGGGRRPVYRYLSKALLNSIRFDELQRLRTRFPDILNDLDGDSYYDAEGGSRPESQEQEMMQTWEALSSYAGSDEQIEITQCMEWLERAEQLYRLINASPGLRLMERSNQAHIESIRQGLRSFAQLADINL